MAGEFRTYQTTPPSSGLAPTALLGPSGLALEGPLGDAKDALAAAAKLAVKARMPSLAPSDALAALGRERSIVRAINESDASYAVRVGNAWTSWLWAGTAYGLLSALLDLGYSDCVIAQRTGRLYSMNSSRVMSATTVPLWTFAGSSNWNQFVLLFVPPLPASWSSLPASNSDEVNRIRQVIAAWKPAHAICTGITVLQTGKLWGYPVRTWGSGGTWGPSTSTNWSYP